MSYLLLLEFDFNILELDSYHNINYFRFSLRFLKKGSCQLLAKVCARSLGGLS